MTTPPLTVAWAYVVLAVVLVISAVTDIRSGRVYNFITYPAILIGLVGHTMAGWIWGTEAAIGPVGSLGGLAVGFIPLLLAWSAGWIGGGDAKLMGAIGALGGWRFALAAMFYGFAVAGLMAIVVMIRRKVVRRTVGRLWRYLYLSLTPGRTGKVETADSPTVPFGLALCVGSGVALIEAVVRGAGAPKLLLGI